MGWGIVVDGRIERLPRKPRTPPPEALPREIIEHILSFALYRSPHRIKDFCTPSARAMKKGVYCNPVFWENLNYKVHLVLRILQNPLYYYKLDFLLSRYILVLFLKAHVILYDMRLPSRVSEHAARIDYIHRTFPLIFLWN